VMNRRFLVVLTLVGTFEVLLLFIGFDAARGEALASVALRAPFAFVQTTPIDWPESRPNRFH